MFHERILLRDTLLEIELRADSTYLLRYGGLVEYTERGRRVRGRLLPYEFRSVEQLRYDFEQDVAAAGGRLGEAA